MAAVELTEFCGQDKIIHIVVNVDGCSGENRATGQFGPKIGLLRCQKQYMIHLGPSANVSSGPEMEMGQWIVGHGSHCQ